jgi:hypothetical protein
VGPSEETIHTLVATECDFIQHEVDKPSLGNMLKIPTILPPSGLSHDGVDSAFLWRGPNILKSTMRHDMRLRGEEKWVPVKRLYTPWLPQSATPSPFFYHFYTYPSIQKSYVAMPGVQHLIDFVLNGRIKEGQKIFEGGGLERRASNFCNAIVGSHDLISFLHLPFYPKKLCSHAWRTTSYRLRAE